MRYDYLENYTYYDKQKKTARARYDQGIQIKITPDQDNELLMFFSKNQDTPYHLAGTNNISWPKRILAWWLSGGVAGWAMLIGSLRDSNNCKDLVRIGLNEYTQYKTDDSIKPNNRYNEFNEKYKENIIQTYNSRDYK